MGIVSWELQGTTAL